MQLVYKVRYLWVYKWSSFFKRIYWQIFGMKIGKGSKLGALKVTWPQKVKIGSDTTIENVFFKHDGPYSEGISIIVGDNCFIGNNVEINICQKVIIGNYTLIGSGTKIVDHNHGIIKSMLIKSQPSNGIRDIVIENDVWIGFNSVILPGSKIGTGAVLAAQSVLNKEIKEYEIWAGIPAKKIGVRKLS